MHIFNPSPKSFSFTGCHDCFECCSGERFVIAPLIVQDFHLVKDHFPILFGYVDNELKALMVFSDGQQSCPYLINNVCSIYSLRPPACKTYPLTPFNDQILCDTSCPGVQTKSDFPLGVPFITSDNKVSNDFNPSRFNNFKTKLNKTKEWLLNVEDQLVPFNKKIKGIELFQIKPGTLSDTYSIMHLNSLKHINLFGSLRKNND